MVDNGEMKKNPLTCVIKINFEFDQKNINTSGQESYELVKQNELKFYN